MTREEFINWLQGFTLLTPNDIYDLGQLYDEVTKPQWISVDEELPKDSCYILVTSRGIVHQWRYGVLESADVLKNMYGITHWMPFPQPPKGGES